MRLSPSSVVVCSILAGGPVLATMAAAQPPPPNGGRNLTECGLLDELILPDAARVAVARVELARRGPAAIEPVLDCIVLFFGPSLTSIEFDPSGAALLDNDLAAVAEIGPKGLSELTRLVGVGGEKGALASGVLGMMGPSAAPAAAKLLTATASEDLWLRGGARNALPRLGVGAVPALIAGLSSANEDIRTTAAQVLGKIAQDPTRSVPALIKALPDRDGSVRDAVAAALGAFGPAANGAVKALLDPRVGEDIDEYGFGDALALIVTDPATLKPALHSPQERTSRRAAKALGQMPAGTTLLLEALGSDSPTVRLSAVSALRPEFAGATAASPVAHALPGGDPAFQKSALILLGSLGPAAAPFLPEIVPMLASPDAEVRSSAIQAMENLAATPEQMGPVVKSLGDADPAVRQAAAGALVRRPAGAASAPAILKVMAAPGSNPLVAVAAARLGRVEAVAPLREMLSSGDPAQSRAAAYGLAFLGPKAAGAADELLAAFKIDEAGRCEYWVALREIGPAGARGLAQARATLSGELLNACEERHAAFLKRR